MTSSKLGGHTSRNSPKKLLQKKTWHVRAKCTICDFVSPLTVSAVVAGLQALKHQKENHPDAEGIVAYMFEDPSSHS
jgi:hypothetical protein